ncbi:MAG TPA: DUF1127 domain-containing protein [Geminicoccaceae bacterium]|nr:DUF1127 domain-containing protein [Geminicoccaceae bacterium]
MSRAHPNRRLARLLGVLGTWRARSRERAELARLDDLALKDIGINRLEALREAQKPFWRG